MLFHSWTACYVQFLDKIDIYIYIYFFLCWYLSATIVQRISSAIGHLSSQLRRSLHVSTDMIIIIGYIYLTSLKNDDRHIINVKKTRQIYNETCTRSIWEKMRLDLTIARRATKFVLSECIRWNQCTTDDNFHKHFLINLSTCASRRRSPRVSSSSDWRTRSIHVNTSPYIYERFFTSRLKSKLYNQCEFKISRISNEIDLIVLK